MKKLNFSQMEVLNGGQEVTGVIDWESDDEFIKVTSKDWGCFFLGMAAGIASGMNPVVGGLTVYGCMLIENSK